MKKYILWIATFAVGTVVANEYRLPLSRSDSYDFDQKDEAGWNVQFGSSAYKRQADRAFSGGGTATNNLTALIFNKDTFRLSNIFENCWVPYNTEYYNPYMRVITMKPRIKYVEEGVVFTGSIDRDVLNERGRWGVRVRVPVKTVEIERLDEGTRRDSQSEDVVQRKYHPKTGDLEADIGMACRLDFFEAMPSQAMTAAADPVIYTHVDKGIRFNDQTADGFAIGAVSSPEGTVPRKTFTGVANNSTRSILPTDLNNLSTTTIYHMPDGTDYSALSDRDAADVATRAANQDKKAQVWVVTLHDPGDGENAEGTTSKVMSSHVTSFLPTLNANIYEWMHDRGYDLSSSKQMGLGDIEMDLYYDHMLSDRTVAGVNFTAKLPTAYGSQFNDNNFAGNPYRAHLGNGGHFEVGGGAHLDCEATAWLAWHVDGTYTFALDATEKRCAVPQNTYIKNMGPETTANVSWSTAVANLELHMCHPRTTDITTTIGYRLYYKTADTIKFKNATIESWLGKTFDATANDYTVANPTTLDNTLAAKNSEQWGHTIRFGTTYHISDWFTMSGNAAFTVAGKNVPKTFEWQCACRITL